MAIVAGGTGGLGRAVSLAFLQEGARVVVTFRQEEEYTALRSAAQANAGALEGHRVDMTDELAVAEFVAGVVARHGQLDAVVNTIGGYVGGIKLWEMETKVLDTMLALNLRSGFMLARSVLPVMLKQRHGSLINVAAKAAVRPRRRRVRLCRVKSRSRGAHGFACRRRHGNRGKSELYSAQHHRYPKKSGGDAGADFASWPKPEDIAQVILFLASDAARTIHGAAVPVYGNG